MADWGRSWRAAATSRLMPLSRTRGTGTASTWTRMPGVPYHDSCATSAT